MGGHGREVVKEREIPVDGVQQPERGDIGGSVFDNAFDPFAMSCRQCLTLDEQNVQKASGKHSQMQTAADFEKRWDKTKVNIPNTIGDFIDPSDGDALVAVPVFFLKHQPNIGVEACYFGLQGVGIEVRGRGAGDQVACRVGGGAISFCAVSAKSIECW